MAPLLLHRSLLLLLFVLPLLISSALSTVTVTHLPGFTGALPFRLQTGYVNVDEVNGVELFYYFIQSEKNPREDPLLLWLTGGPGCSAFSGLVFEIGPLRFITAKYNGSVPSLVYNPYSWTKVASIVFLDSPVGTEFSFSRNPKGYDGADDTTSSKRIYEFLRKWFAEHPQFLSNDLYIAGDSYAGKVVPIVSNEIAQGIEAGNHPLLNLKGYLVGNPVTGEVVDLNSRVPYAHGVGIISDELYQVIHRNCEGEDYDNPNPLNLLCTSALGTFDLFLSEINKGYTLDPKCPFECDRKYAIRARSLKGTHSQVLQPSPVPGFNCRAYTYYLSYYWANNHRTREALHIKKGTVNEWVRCNCSIYNSISYTKSVASSVIYHLNLTKKGYRALVYSGDKDLVIPFIGTETWIKSLNFQIEEKWRSWHVNGQVAGYTTKYSNLTFTTVKDAGHTAPEYKPEHCMVMLDRWISNDRL